MLFIEKKNINGYSYRVEDLFGEIDIESTKKLDGGTLDDMVSLLLRQTKSAGTVTGDVKHEGGRISYIFKKASQWSNEIEKIKCENTHTSIAKQVKEFIQINLLRIPILNWLIRFVVVFREVWKKGSR